MARRLPGANVLHLGEMTKRCERRVDRAEVLIVRGGYVHHERVARCG